MNIHDLREFNSPISRRLPPLPALRCFEAAARLESFTRAGEELHLTHGAISRAVRAVEQSLGVELFERRNRRVFLNPAGRTLHRAVEHALGLIASAAQELRATRDTPSLVLSCEPTLMMRWLIPRMASFHASHPDIELRLMAGGGPVSFRDGIDLAIRRNDFAWHDTVHAEHLFDETVGPVGQPARLREWIAKNRARPTLKTGAPLLQSATRPRAWREWLSAHGQRHPSGRERVFEHFYFSLQAASAGLGLAIGPWALVRDDIETGLLAAPFGFTPDGSSYHLLSPRPIAPGSHAAAVLAWLRTLA